MPDTLSHDIDAIARIPVIATILDVVCRTTGMGFAAVARVTEDRWIACAVKDDIAFGLKPGGELDVATTICDEIRESGKAVVIDHVDEDAAFCHHPTPARYGFQSYISMPIFRSDGSFFGTLCAIDPRPARLKRPEIIGMFRLFADLVAFHLDAADRMAASESALADERREAELREQFIAVLGHDLRGPIAAVDAGAGLLLREPATEHARTIVAAMQGSTRRMGKLVGEILDFAQGRLGGGFPVTIGPAAPLRPALEEVVQEIRTASPGRAIELQCTLDRPVACDRARIQQLVANLVGNALTHGAQTTRVVVSAHSDATALTIEVANQGEPIPASLVAQIFRPFFRAAADGNQQGLGLGLYIASEVARAHGGTLAVRSSAEETRFTFRMPVG